jgi:copper resistance protein C
MKRTSLLGAALLLGALVAAPVAASAHALLREAIPAVGSTVHGAPQTLTLRFSEGVEPAFTTVVVTDASGTHVEAGRPQTAPDDARQISVPLKPLSPGTYTVTWHATSVDTHRTEGHFTFTVAP